MKFLQKPWLWILFILVLCSFWQIELSLVIPIRLRISDTEIEMRDQSESEKIWQSLIEDFRNYESATEAYALIEPKLQSIASSRPDSIVGVRAQLLALADPSLERKGQLGNWAIRYAERSLVYPSIYFSANFRKSSESIAIRALKQLTLDGNREKASKLCFQLRWISQDVSELGPICSETMTQTRIGLGYKLSSTLKALYTGRYHRIPGGFFDLSSRKAISRYLQNPYHPFLTKELIRATDQTQDQLLSSFLKTSLAQEDPVKLWEVENGK